MKNFAIGSLALITNNVANPNFILQTPIAGLDSPETRVNYYDKPGQDGGNVSSMFYGKRPISLQGVIYASNPTDFETARRALAAACQINKDSNGYPVPTLITFTTMAGNSYSFYAYIDRPIYDYDTPNSSNFMITMTATNPFLQGTTTFTSGAIVRASGGGFILPVILPIVSSAGVGGTGIVTNIGNAAAYPIVTLVGPLTNPYIYNATVGKFMQLNVTIGAGQIVVIDMANKTITLGGSSLLSAKASGSDWWTVVPGSNNINLTTESASDSGNVTVTGSPAYLGA